MQETAIDERRILRKTGVIPHSRVRYAADEGFQRVLQRRVRAQLAQHPRGENTGMLCQQLVAGAWLYACLALLVFVPLPFWAVAVLTCTLGLAIAGLMMIVVHDAAHYSVSRRRWLNNGMGWLTAATLAVTPDWWAFKHNGTHHPYTSIAGFDDDLDIGKLVRVAREQPWKPWHRFQHIYVFAVAPLIYLNMIFVADMRFVILGRIGARRVERPTIRRAAWLLFRKFAGVTVVVAIALTQHSLTSVIAVTLVATIVAGAMIAMIFQVQHCVPDTVFPERDPQTGAVDRSWFVAQAEAAADFGTGNRLLTWYSGALNYHIEHHLFARVPHNLLPELRPIVRETCAEFGVHQVEYRTLRGAVRAHYRFLKRMGERPALTPEPALLG